MNDRENTTHAESSYKKCVLKYLSLYIRIIFKVDLKR